MRLLLGFDELNRNSEWNKIEGKAKEKTMAEIINPTDLKKAEYHAQPSQSLIVDMKLKAITVFIINISIAQLL